MSAKRDRFDWQRIYAELDRRLTSLGTSFEHDDERAAAILRERSIELALAPEARARQGGAAMFLVFKAGGARYGLPVGALQEVMRVGRVAPVPGAAAGVRGVAIWRGDFVTLFDVGLLLGQGRPVEAPEYAVIFRDATPRVGLAIERAEGIVQLDPAALQRPDAWQSGRPDLFRGASADAVALFDAARLTARLHEDLRAA